MFLICCQQMTSLILKYSSEVSSGLLLLLWCRTLLLNSLAVTLIYLILREIHYNNNLEYSSIMNLVHYNRPPIMTNTSASRVLYEIL